MRRDGSSSYWNTDAWDPDERVYVGASDGATHHQVAVEDKKGSDDHSNLLAGPTRVIQTTSRLKVHSDGKSSDYWDMANDGRQTSSATLQQSAAMPVRTGGYANSSLPTAVPLAPSAGNITEEAKVTQPSLSSVSGPESASQHKMRILDTSNSSSSYWDFDPQRLGSPSHKHPPKANACEESKEEPSDALSTLKRASSGAYWEADQWDPDLRIYVGAEAGQGHHLQAVDLSESGPVELWKVWVGGLAAETLGLASTAGPPIDLKASGLQARPSIEDLYAIGDMSGSGSFGVVRSAVHRSSGTSCVVKCINKIAAGERYRQNLVDHGLGETLLRMSKEAAHPNIAKYIDMIEGPKHFYVIMEELHGAELMKQVEDLFPLTEAVVQKILKQILAGLAHLHEKVCVVHRDVKLSNFRYRTLDKDSDLVLLDFGFAMSVKHEWDGAVCGTMMFMAPEVIGQSAKIPWLAAIDMWAVGIILFVLLTGDAPVNQENVKCLGNVADRGPADEVLCRAFEAPELSTASNESLELLRALLVLDPTTRLTATQALDHRWFSADVDHRKIPVSSAKYRLVRSASNLSQTSSYVSNPSDAQVRTRRVKSTLGLPPKSKSEKLERIVSEGAEELQPH